MITRLLRGLLLSGVVMAGLTACASNPDKIQAAYVSPLKYQNYDCDLLVTEMDYVTQRVNRLHGQLAKDAKADKWQMGVGIVLFWPTLFALEGGDGPEAAEYAQLKGEFEAIRTASVQQKCGSNFTTLQEAVEASNAPKSGPEAKENAASRTTVAMLTDEPALESKKLLLGDADKCVIPRTPGPISQTPDRLELLNAKRALDLYQEENSVYRGCLEGSLQSVDSQAGKDAIVTAHNAALTVEEALAEEFNQALNTYQNKGE